MSITGSIHTYTHTKKKKKKKRKRKILDTTIWKEIGMLIQEPKTKGIKVGGIARI